MRDRPHATSNVMIRLHGRLPIRFCPRALALLTTCAQALLTDLVPGTNSQSRQHRVRFVPDGAPARCTRASARSALGRALPISIDSQSAVQTRRFYLAGRDRVHAIERRLEMKSGKRLIQLILATLLLLLLLGLTPTQAEAAPIIRAISAGRLHTCALTDADRVWCWGMNWDAQLGNGQSGNISATPVRVLGLDGVKTISAGGGYTCSLKRDGRVWCWGSNYRGQLGNGQSGNISATPVRVLNLSGITSISAGNGHACALKQGTVWCWGSNEYGQLGNGTSGTGKFSAIPVRTLNLTGIKAISAGDSHTCAVTTSGAVRCWGRNFDGQLGNGLTSDSSIPVRVLNLSGVKAVEAGGWQTCALKEGAVWCWGDNDYGELGNPQVNYRSVTPVRVPSLSGVTSIDSFWLHTCAVRNLNTVWCWGWNDYGQLGLGWSGDDAYSATAARVLNLTGVKAVSAGATHTCALTGSGAVKCWGDNRHGTLGNGQSGNEQFKNVPVAVVWPASQ